MKKKHLLMVVTIIAISTTLIAQDNTHKHGNVKMEVVLEEKEMNISFHLTKSDLLGFELNFNNEHESHKIESIIDNITALEEKIISIKTRWFTEIDLEEIHIEPEPQNHDSHGGTEDHDSHEDTEDHDSHGGTEDHDSHGGTEDHDSHGGTEDHDSHEDTEDHDSHEDTEDHDKETNTHQEYIIHLRYSFQSSSRLKYINLKPFFNLFPTLESIDWVLIHPRGQNAGHSTINKTLLDLQ